MIGVSVRATRETATGTVTTYLADSSETWNVHGNNNSEKWKKIVNNDTVNDVNIEEHHLRRITDAYRNKYWHMHTERNGKEARD